MRLSALLKGVPPGGAFTSDPEIAAIVYDSRAVTPGSAFFALPGTKADGAAFVPAAVAAGAVAVVAAGPCDHGAAALAIVADPRQALAFAAANFYGRPSRTLTLAGVTGTNGKTTTTYLLEGMMTAAGRACGVVGTVEYRMAGKVLPATHTTPGPVELNALLAGMKGAGVDTVIMEVSSHALDMRRVDGLAFDVAAFTNLTRDHLDYHGGMDAYCAAKARLFHPLGLDAKTTIAVINVDDPAGRSLAGGTRYRTLAVSADRRGGAEVHPGECAITIDGIEGTLQVAGARVRVRSRMIGRHNLMNIAVAAGMAHALGAGAAAIEKGIEAVQGVPGRLERVQNGAGVTCLVDYAHTDDALRNVLATLREISPQRIITVFGCGGDRDRGKRPLMGAAAAGLSDVAIVTSDNPRTEDPAAIIAEILPGVRDAGRPAIGAGELAAASSGWAAITDRRGAIAAAVDAAAPGDVVLIAGKGHEDYQIHGTEKRHFDDREEAAAAFAARAGRPT